MAIEDDYFPSGEGRSYRMGRITLTFKSSDAEAGYSICETVEGPGITGASPHRHYTYQETHIVIEGEYECRLGSETFVLGPGGMTFAPKGMLHGMRKLGDGVGRQLLISSPAGVFESFVAEVTAAQVDTGTVGGRAGSIDFRQICAKHGIEFVDEPRPPGTTPLAAPTGGDAP